MDRPRLIRGLRIAASAVCGILCVLVICLWVRSYNRSQLLVTPGTGNVLTQDGYVTLFTRSTFSSLRSNQDWELIEFKAYLEFSETDRLFRRFHFGHAYCYVPYWFPVFVTSTLAAAPWFPWSRRFTLRTLLIATTLIAVLLATAAYLRLW